MNFSGWEFDATILPYWENHNKFPCEDLLFEAPNAEYACLIYSVTEVSMLNYWGFGSILENKDAPRVLLNIKYVNFEPYVHFSKDGNLVFLKANYRYGKRFILVLNLRKKAFSIVHFCTPFCYDIVEKSDGLFEIVFDEKTLSDPRSTQIKDTLINTQELRWRKWTVLEEGGDLNLQNRSLKNLFKSADKIWEETIEKIDLGQMSTQEFIDQNRNKVLYYCSPFDTKENGKTTLSPMKNSTIEGDFFPAFTSLEACNDYLLISGRGPHVIIKGNLKDVMKILDSNYLLRDWGVIIDPYNDFVGIPPGMRITPKSLRY